MRGLAFLALLLVGTLMSAPTHAAGQDTAPVEVTAAVPGFEDPAEVGPSYCESNYDEYPIERWTGSDTVVDQAGTIHIDVGTPSGPGEIQYPVDDDPVVVVGESTEIVVERAFATWCMNDYHETLWPSLRTVWVKEVSTETLIPYVVAQAMTLIHSPTPTWPSRSDAYGWAIVKTPMDIRVEPEAPVSVTAIASNITGTATATATATPDEVVYLSGEPDALPVECKVADATASAKEDGSGCHYVYKNSSAIESDTTFDTATGLRWDIETNSEVFVGGSELLWTTEPLQVAEVQAVVTNS